MKRNYRAIIIGGGVVGVSIAYHLALSGWKDIALLERDELTSGSTWHAAGLLPLFNMSYATSHIHDYSVKLYPSLEKETAMSVGFSKVGNLRMAQTSERMDEYMLYASTAETMGIPYQWMNPKEIKERWPLVHTEDLKGAIFHPTDGYINPADITQVFAKAARDLGVEIFRKVEAAHFTNLNNGWEVSGDYMEEKGGNLIPTGEKFITKCDHLITATGNHAQTTARKLGIKIPAIPVEHQYIVTEKDPALEEFRKKNEEHPVLRDADAKWYVREERFGWILGPYEKNAPARFEFQVPKSFRSDLFPLDLERIEEEYMSLLHRIPSSEKLGLKDDFNGPICYTPDGNPLLGPAPGLNNVWLAEGFSFGITAAGGAGYYLAQLMSEGEAEIDMGSLDPRRYSSWITTEYAKKKNEEAYEHVYILHHPDEEREACRPLRTSPAYNTFKSLGAQFGQVNGWERPNYFAPTGFEDKKSRSFRRGSWWKYSKIEAEAIRSNVGLIDSTAFTKHLVSGKDASQFLDWFTCNKLPNIGRVNLTYALSNKGTIRTEYTIVHLSENVYYLVSAGAWTEYDSDYLKKSLENSKFEDVSIYDCTNQWGVFSIAGPKTKELLKTLLVSEDPSKTLSNKEFPWLSYRDIEVGMCPVRALRVAYTGELGWELHHPIEMQNYLLDIILEAGKNYNLKLVGARAQNWLRQEKSYRAFGSDLGRDAGPFESNLSRFVDLSKDFLGKVELRKRKLEYLCVTLLIDGPEDTDPWGREAIYDTSGENLLGRLTSGGYSVHFKKSIGIGYLKEKSSATGTKVKVKINNKLFSAEVVQDSPYDPKNEKIINRETS